MSFYTGGRQGNMPGPLSSRSSFYGIGEKACISVTKVLDACKKSIKEQNLEVTLHNLQGAGDSPLTFVDMKCGFAEHSNLILERLNGKPDFARVRADVNIPVIISYKDADGAEGTGESKITVPVDIILFVPQPSVVPYRIEFLGAINEAVGQYAGTRRFSLNCFITIIVKIAVDADILVPSYGFCTIPNAREFRGQGGYSIKEELPLFPMAID